MDVKFYKCMHCGNIAVKVFDAGVPLVCCGEKMVELVAGSQDAALEKHVPAVEVEGNKVVVNVGSVDHPMLEEHWIQFIRLVTAKGYTDCVAFMGEDSISVVVDTGTGELTAEDVAKITDIAMTETGYPASGIKIMASN